MLTPVNMRGKLTPAKFTPVNIGGARLVHADWAGCCWSCLVGARRGVVGRGGCGGGGRWGVRGAQDAGVRRSRVRVEPGEGAVERREGRSAGRGGERGRPGGETSGSEA